MRRALLSLTWALVHLVTIVGFTRPAQGHDKLGVWLIEGPIETRELAPRLGRRPLPESWSREAHVSAQGHFDIAELFGRPLPEARSAVARTFLTLREPLEGVLLVGSDGNLEVSVDGTIIHRRVHPHPRGRGLVPIPISLGVGTHMLALGMTRLAERLTFEAELRDLATGRFPSGASLAVARSDLPLAARARLLESHSRFELGSEGLVLVTTVDHARGLPLPEKPPRIELRGRDGTVCLASHPPTTLPDQDALTFHLALHELPEGARPTTLFVEFSGARLERPLDFDGLLLARLEAGLSRLREDAHLAPSDDLDRATLEYGLERLSELILSPTAQHSPRAPLLPTVPEDFDRIGARLDHPGLVQFAVRARIDGRPQPSVLSVPSSYQPSNLRRYPLVVLLHGYDGTPKSVLEAFLDAPLVEGRLPKLEGFVLAPMAHGNAFYRSFGEEAVEDAIDAVLARYPIDPRRISITGVSMGGTGTAELALHAPDRYSAMAPLCGYHSYFARRDTTGRPRRPYEEALMHAFSSASVADSGRHLPLFVAHGLRDHPLENSRSLIRRYRELSYSVTEDWPDLGHAVWKKTYANAGLFPWLTQWQRPSSLERVTLRTPRLRHGRSGFVTLTKLEQPYALGRLDARVLPPNRVAIETEQVHGFRLERPSGVPVNHPWQVTVDGNEIAVEPHQEPHFVREGGAWRLGQAATRRTAALDASLSHFFEGQVVAVIGTLSPAATPLYRALASALVGPRPGVSLAIPVITDLDFLPEAYPDARLLLVGAPTHHRLLKRLMEHLPIRVEGDAIVAGSTRFTGPDGATWFVYPDPERPTRLLGVLTGPRPVDLFWALSLPSLLPDFVIFDRGVEAAAGSPILGERAYVRAGGFFKEDFSLPEPSEFLDPRAPKLLSASNDRPAPP